MKVLRFSATVLLVLMVALAAGRTRATASGSPIIRAGDCSVASLASAFHGPDRLDSVQQFGCEDGYAYVFATIGASVAEVGVTEVEQWRAQRDAWRFVDRATFCNPAHVVAPFVYRNGCFSN